MRVHSAYSHIRYVINFIQQGTDCKVLDVNFLEATVSFETNYKALLMPYLLLLIYNLPFNNLPEIFYDIFIRTFKCRSEINFPLPIYFSNVAIFLNFNHLKIQNWFVLKITLIEPKNYILYKIFPTHKPDFEQVYII